MSRVPEQVRYPFPAMAGITIAAVLCLWGSFRYYGFETAYQRQNQDPYMVSAQFTRLGPLLSVVPENAVMGYLTDAQPGSVSDSAMLGTAQYVLAPRLLTKGSGPDWVLGNFARPADFAALADSHGLRLQKDFGNGVVLFRKAGERP